MRESSLVPTNLLDWPRCNNLLPDQRLILLWLWSAPWLSCAGSGAVPIRAAAATLGLSGDALARGISDLVKLKLVALDHETGELFILDWFRFHKFKTPVSLKSLASAIKKVQSEALKNEITIKSAGCFPTSTSTSTSTSTKVIHTLAPSRAPQIQSQEPEPGVSQSTAVKAGCVRMVPIEIEIEIETETETHALRASPFGGKEGQTRLKPLTTPAQVADFVMNNPSLTLSEARKLRDRLDQQSEATL